MVIYNKVMYMTNLKQNLIERSTEIKMVLERELRALDAPCTISDLMKRCGASRMPIEKHIKSLMANDAFAHVGLVRIGGYDVVYRRCAVGAVCPDPMSHVDSPTVASQETATTTDNKEE